MKQAQEWQITGNLIKDQLHLDGRVCSEQVRLSFFKVAKNLC